jgi:general secretion pathway protein L
MAQRILGIDISDELLCGVVVDHRGRETQVVDCASQPLEDIDQLSSALPLLLEQLTWHNGTCVSGISLSHFSLRNFFLPFTNEKKIEQILPFELEEHMLVPLDEQIFAAKVVRQRDEGSDLLVAAIEKSRVRAHLDSLKAAGIQPRRLGIASLALAEYLCETGRGQEDFVLLYGDTGSMTLVLCQQQKTMFMRRIAYPEAVFTDTVFALQGHELHIADTGAARVAIQNLCGQIKQSLERFSTTCSMEYTPGNVVLAGVMQLESMFAEQVEQELALPCTVCNLVQTGSVTLASNVREKWFPAFFDRPLALALQAENKKNSFDFLKDEFALPSQLIGSRKQAVAAALAVGLVLAGCLGYLFFDYRTLQNRHDRLSARMDQVFKKSFPGATKIVDPLLQMRSRLQEVQAPTVSMPLFTQEQRILAILSDISSRVPDSISMHVTRMVIDEESVKMKGTTDAFNNVNTIKKLLAKSPRYQDVSIVSATKSKEKNTIRFEIRLELEENS